MIGNIFAQAFYLLSEAEVTTSGRFVIIKSKATRVTISITAENSARFAAGAKALADAIASIAALDVPAQEAAKPPTSAAPASQSSQSGKQKAPGRKK